MKAITITSTQGKTFTLVYKKEDQRDMMFDLITHDIRNRLNYTRNYVKLAHKTLSTPSRTTFEDCAGLSFFQAILKHDFEDKKPKSKTCSPKKTKTSSTK